MVLLQFTKTRIYKYLIICEILIIDLKQVDRYLYFPISFLNPNLGGFYRDSFWAGGSGRRGKNYPFSCLKLVRITLETSNLARKYIHICSFRKHTFWYQAPLNFADATMFLQKLAFFGQNSTFNQSNSVRGESYVRRFLVLFLFFIR